MSFVDERDPVEELKKEFDILPEEIRKEELRILGFSNNISRVNSEMEEIKVYTMASITKEVITIDESTKKKFGNMDARDSELNKRLNINKDYNELNKSLSFSKDELTKTKIKLNFLNNRFSAIKYLTKLFIKEEK